MSVDHNNPRRENFASTLFDQIEIFDDEDFCDDIENEISIFTIANGTDEIDVAGVNLSYTCGIYTCNLGQSEWVSFGAAAALKKPFPYCVNGILRGNKQGFEESEMFIQTDIPGTYFMFLKPIKEFTNYVVVKHDFDNPGTEIKLEENEKARITINSVDGNFKTAGVYPSEGDSPIMLLNENSAYDVTIFLSDENDIIGGYQGTWTVTSDQLNGKSTIKFHVLEKEGNQDERILLISGLESYSQNIPKPELI